MPLAAGEKLGPYEIVKLLGAGGMGEVYKARDTRLDRIVAIKVSKGQFSERFEREARAVAALNHPHICQLYDIGVNYLVIEFIEGTPLAGPMPLKDAVDYAGQILDALDAAHRKGITHRDLKPANILLTKQGIKLLDFGLAKQSGPLQETESTLTDLTGKGQIVGTLRYMSPEQLQGKEADPRSDLFSFGCVLYEMLTARRPFEGQSAASVIAAILEREPLPLETAAPLERVVHRCLAKDPDQRFQTARDLKAALLWALEPGAGPTTIKIKSNFSWYVAGTLAIVAAVALWVPSRTTRPAETALQPMLRFDVDLGSDVALGSAGGANAILSPDGTRLVYLSQSRLFTRRLDQAKSTEMTGTEGADAPFFSPDGQWVAFFSAGKLKKISVQGGDALTLSTASFVKGGSWGEDGNIIASSGDVLLRIPSAGGAPTPVTELAPGEVSHCWPQVLPGGGAVLFSVLTSLAGVDGASIEFFSLKDRRRKTILRGGTWGRYLPSGHLIYVNDGTLFAAGFDVDRIQMRSTPVPILADVAYDNQTGLAQFDSFGTSSSPGTVVYSSGGVRAAMVTVQWLDAASETRPLLAKPGDYRYPRLSPDGNRLALSSGGDIWVFEWQRETMTRLTFDGSHTHPIWSADGEYIVFRGPEGMFWTRADGAAKPQPLTRSTNQQYPSSITADGKRLAFYELNPKTGFDIWTVSLDVNGALLQAGKPEIFVQTPFDERHPSFSPDGRWLAYASAESGIQQVYVREFPGRAPGASGKWLISNGGGGYPVWSRHGQELFFRTEDDKIIVAAYTVIGNSFVAHKPRVWSEKKLAHVGFLGAYDVGPDGKRIAALVPAETPEGQKAQNHIIFLLNFFDELRRRVPLGSK